MSEHRYPWWFPELNDDDERDGKYRTLWDHAGDAQEEFDALADSFLELLAALKKAKQLAQTLADRGGDPWITYAIDGKGVTASELADEFAGSINQAEGRND